MGPRTSVEDAVRRSVDEGAELWTPARPQPFGVGRISSDGIVLELGEKRTPTLFRWKMLEGTVSYLRDRGEMPINGGGKSLQSKPNTLDWYLKQHINRLTAGWVAVLLEKAGIAQIDRSKRPQTIGAV